MGPLVCLSEATSPFGYHLARTGQVGEGIPRIAVNGLFWDLGIRQRFYLRAIGIFQLIHPLAPLDLTEGVTLDNKLESLR